jgi:hypothetical protein
MAPHGRLAGAALAGRLTAPGWAAGEAGAALLAGGVASRCVTWLDCLPKDLPPPMRLAKASVELSTMEQTNIIEKNFIMIISKN